MMVEVKRINYIDLDILEKITTWMYEFEGKEKGYSYDEVKSFMKTGMSNDYPYTYGIFLDDKFIGMCQVSYGILEIGGVYYPWFMNMYIDKDYRGKGYCRKLFNEIKGILKETTDFTMAIASSEYDDFLDRLDCFYLCDVEMKLNGKTTKEKIYRILLR